MKKHQHVYSPLPIEAYYISYPPACPARTSLTLPNPVALWNLFYLSRSAELDTFPAISPKLHKGMISIVDTLMDLADDIISDDELALYATKELSVFLAWWNADHDCQYMFKAYESQGEGEWIKRVASRAESLLGISKEAPDLVEPPQQLISSGNILRPDFGRVRHPFKILGKYL